MKINIKDVFEKEDKDIRIHTNDRLDIDEIFSEAREDKVEEEQFPSNEVEIDTAQEEAIQEDDGLNSDIDSAEAVENDECSISSEPCSSDEDEVPAKRTIHRKSTKTLIWSARLLKFPQRILKAKIMRVF